MIPQQMKLNMWRNVFNYSNVITLFELSVKKTSEHMRFCECCDQNDIEKFHFI